METEPEHHTPPDIHHSQRPRGILKNSFRNDSAQQDAASPTSPTDEGVTLQNTLQNAGHRRSSSSAARSSASRRASGANFNATTDDDSNQRLKWDEANLYLTEQEKSSTMKITEPKTPYAQRYDPMEDADEMQLLDAEDLHVDELDQKKHIKNDDIPDLELGEPEETITAASDSHDGRMSRSGSLRSNKQVVVDPDAEATHEGAQSEDDEIKHKRFAEMRKKHYEMRDVKNLLGHPEDPIDDDDDGDGIPRLPKNNGDTRMNGV